MAFLLFIAISFQQQVNGDGLIRLASLASLSLRALRLRFRVLLGCTHSLAVEPVSLRSTKWFSIIPRTIYPVFNGEDRVNPGGGGWIRTIELIREQIDSLPRLTTSLPHHVDLSIFHTFNCGTSVVLLTLQADIE